MKTIRRYIYVVEELMEGCGWSTERSKEMLSILNGQKQPGKADKEDTTRVLEEEFGSLDLQNEIERLKKTQTKKADDKTAVAQEKKTGGKKKKKKKKK
jgi:hypothetical protein